MKTPVILMSASFSTPFLPEENWSIPQAISRFLYTPLCHLFGPPPIRPRPTAARHICSQLSSKTIMAGNTLKEAPWLSTDAS